jgi:hypothetical protein
MAAVALPQLLVNELSDKLRPVDPRAHYVAAVVPFLVAGAILALARVSPRNRARVAVLILSSSVALSVLAGPWPSTPAGGTVRYTQKLPASRLDSLRAAVARVPGDAPVSATNAAGSHLSARRYFYSVPNLGRAKWVVVDTWDRAMAPVPPGVRSFGTPGEFVDALRASGEWQQVFAREGVFVLRKLQAS